jgi:hypothetical protein
VAAGGTVLALATIPPALAAAPPGGPADPVFGLIAAHKQIMETVRATAAEIRHSTEDEAIALEKVSLPSKIRTNLICLSS